jgi:hypothetical protein
MLLSSAKICGDLVVNIWKAAGPAQGVPVPSPKGWKKLVLDAVRAHTWSKLLVKKQLEQLALKVLMYYGSRANPLIGADQGGLRVLRRHGAIGADAGQF